MSRLQSQHHVNKLGKGYAKVFELQGRRMWGVTLEETHGAPELGGTRLWLVRSYTKQWQKEGTDMNTLKE